MGLLFPNYVRLPVTFQSEVKKERGRHVYTTISFLGIKTGRRSFDVPILYPNKSE